MNELEQQLFETCRQKNHELVEANTQLLQLLSKSNHRVMELTEQYDEQQRYVEYLERTLHETGWNPNAKR